MNRHCAWRNLMRTRLLQAVITGAIFDESRLLPLDLRQFCGNGRAMRQNASFNGRCIINAS
jgi:hypothetical protein